MSVSEEPLRAYPVASLRKDLAPWGKGGRMASMNATCPGACAAVVAISIQWCLACQAFACLGVEDDLQTKAPMEKTLEYGIA